MPIQAAAVTRVRYNAITGEFFDVDIAFNGQPVSLVTNLPFTWAVNTDPNNVIETSLDVRNVATHEIGHYSALKDLYNPGDAGYILEMKNMLTI